MLLQLLFSLCVVILLMYSVLVFFKKYAHKLLFKNNSNSPSFIELESVLYIDSSNKVVSLHWKQNHYLLAIGKNGPIIIDYYKPEKGQ